MNPHLTDEKRTPTDFGAIYSRRWTRPGYRFDTPIVLLHDSLGCVELWRGFPEILATVLSRPIIAYDRLGFGRSDAQDTRPRASFVEDEYAAGFTAIKKAYALDKYLLLGHSVGGGMALHIASEDPGCEGVMTIAAQAFVEERTVTGIKAAKLNFERPGQLAKLEKYHGGKAKWVLDAWTEVWLSPAFAAWSVAPYIGRVTCPVLAIHGDRDQYGSLAFPERIVGRAGGRSEMAILKGVGHAPHRENLDDTLDYIADFLALHQIS